MTSLKYRVYLNAQTAIALEAAKVNTGELRLWFFDQHSNLLALFQWSEILGFAVEGPAEGQILTDQIPLEMGKIADDNLSVRGRQHLESIRRQLQGLADSDIPL